MSTAGSLADRTKTELATLARRKGIKGWETMTKDALVQALTRLLKASKPKPGASAKSGKSVKPSKSVKTVGRVVAKSAAKSSATGKAGSASKPGSTARAAKSSASTGPSREQSALNGTSAKSPPPGQPDQPEPQPGGDGTTAAPPQSSAAAKELTAAKEPTATAAATASPAAAAKPAKASEVKPLFKPLIKPQLTGRESGSSYRSSPPAKDRVYLAVNDPYWLHVMWELSAQSIQRAEAALKQDWYGAKLILRLYDVTSYDTTSTHETHLRDEEVPNDGRNWYIQVAQPPRQYRVDVGYLSRRGDFFLLAKSNIVTPPKAGTAEALDVGWEKDPKKAERILAMSTGFESASHPELKEMFEERYGRSLGPPKETAFGSGATPPGSMKKFFFEIGAKLIVYGRTDPNAHVTLGNDPLDLSPNGTFVMEFNLPDSRQIIPAVATSADGVEERTIVLAIERNTKYLDPMIHDQMSEG
jgi:hypothetical protein